MNREHIKKLIDEIPEYTLEHAERFLRYLKHEDEILTESEIKEIEEAKQEIERGEYYTFEEALKELEGEE